MASRQLNFYVLPEEQGWLDGLLRGVGSWLVVGRLDASGKPKLLPTTVLQRFGQEDLKIYLVRKDDLSRICSISAPNRSELFVDDLRSPVIECSRCFSDGKVLRRGRLYFVESYFDAAGQLVRKDPDFIEAGRAMLATVRRSMQKRNDGDYASDLSVQREREAALQLTAD